MEDEIPAHHHAVSPDNMAVAKQQQQDDSSSSSDDDDDDEPIMVGGDIATPAFALLDGVVYGKNLDQSECEKITVPITRIPATLGRSHENPDEHFFGLGPKKAISREQCRIYFQEPNGGRFVWKDNSKFVFEPHKGKKRPPVIPLEKDESLPAQGFFAIECLGKNKITVGKNRVEQGQVAQLESGTPIRMSTVCLFFLLPTDASFETMEIPAPKTPRKRPAAAKADGEPSAKKQSSGGPYAAILQEFETMSADALLAEMREAIDSDEWERRHQLMGGVLAYHAVKDASRSKKIRKEVRESGGVSRKAIMDWIAASPKYGFWVRHTLNRVEFASYQSTVTKVLQKAGYERQGKHGRFVKWRLPPSAEVESEVSDEEGSNDEGDDNDDASEKSPSDDAKMPAVGGEKEAEDEDEDSSDDDEKEGGAQESATDNKGEASNNDDDDDDDDDSQGDDSVDSSDDDAVGSSVKPGSSTKDEPGVDSGDDSDSDSSDDEKALSSTKADEDMEDVEGSDDDGEGGSSPSELDEGKDETMAGAEESPA